MIGWQLIIPIIASILGAFIGASFAFRYQTKMEIRKEKRSVLQVLMMFRNVGANAEEWIKALNVIDLVYHDRKKIVELYHKFVEYTDPRIIHTNQYYEVFCQMLYEMAQCTGYKNLSETDIRRIYAPEALAQHYPHMFSKNVLSNSTGEQMPPSIPHKEAG